MLSNFELEDISTQLKLPLIGVFSKDELPLARKVGDYIINLQSADDGNGTHWVFFKIFNSKDAIYFDPFGMGMPQEVGKFLQPFKPVMSNNRQIQDIKSESCGMYCISCSYFFKYDADSKKTIVENYDDYLNIWSWDTKLNDKVLKQYLSKY